MAWPPPQAATRCGAHARALQYYETWVRQEQQGGLNPSAYNTSVEYTSDQVRAQVLPSQRGNQTRQQKHGVPGAPPAPRHLLACVRAPPPPVVPLGLKPHHLCLLGQPLRLCPPSHFPLPPGLALPKPNPPQVSFLLEVYGQLEEPDGVAGLLQLRQGGLTPADQVRRGATGRAGTRRKCSPH